MYKKILSSIFCLFLAVLTFAQTYNKPIYEKRKNPNVEITKIQLTEKYTIVDYVYRNPFKAGGWACASTDTYIQDVVTKKKYKVIKSSGIPMCPEKKQFIKGGKQILRYRLFFPPIKLNRTDTKIDIIEPAEVNSFSFYKVLLIIRA